MHLKEQESGSAAAPAATVAETKHIAILDAKIPTPDFKSTSSTLPLGQMVPISSISGPTYVTAQLLVQQAAYKLSDKIFSYSPETFDLDVAAKHWSSEKETNIHGHTTTLVPLETRTGAGAFALGYMFSKDFDLNKKDIPQSLLAPSMSLNHLRGALDQLSLLYSVATPFVAHVAAADYTDADGLVSEYSTALQLAEELGLGLVSSASSYEAQHMAVFATLMAKVLPSVHIYDGLRTARETLRVIDTVSETGIKDLYTSVSKTAAGLNQRLDDAGKVLELLKSLNDELGTEYQPFEYYGHEEAETVIVVFGSVEAQLAKQVVAHLATNGVKVGSINVRLYRPFVEEAFLEALPSTTKTISVLGQVANADAVTDNSVQSVLYTDVLTAVSFSDKLQDPAVVEVKYPASQVLTPQSFGEIVRKAASVEADAEIGTQLLSPDNTMQFSFWDVDNSEAVSSPSVLGHIFSRQSTANVFVSQTHDNLVQGGIVRADIRVSKRTIEAPYPVTEADVAFVGEEKLLGDLDIVATIKDGGKLILKVTSFKDEDAEKRIAPAARQQIQAKGIQLIIFDTSASEVSNADKFLAELAFLKVARPEILPQEYGQFVLVGDGAPVLTDALAAVEKSIRQIKIPESWATLPEDLELTPLPTAKPTSFVGFDKEEPEETLALTTWESAAKALVFKEAYGTQSLLRPDLTVKTSRVTVKENRRLTPTTYDRNIFHIEFDLGSSGLTYQIGEALGIHAENDPLQVEEFLSAYDPSLDATSLVQVPARENPDGALETRTVHQALVQNIDIFGKPPKRFYEALSSFATDAAEKNKLSSLGSAEGAEDFKKRAEVDTVSFSDILLEFKSARPAFHDLARIVGPMKRREYSIASAQAVTPNSVALMIVVVDWVDGRGRKRMGQATRYLSTLTPGTPVTVSVKPSVMKLPTNPTAPLIMAGLGTGLAPFRAFVQHRALQASQGVKIGSILLYMGSRHQREEYLYGEEWEAYLASGVVTLLGAAFSRDQPRKVYIQDKMRESLGEIVKAFVEGEGSFYLCGPTWPVPDVQGVLEEAIQAEAKGRGKRCGSVESKREIERLKEGGRYVLEVY